MSFQRGNQKKTMRDLEAGSFRARGMNSYQRRKKQLRTRIVFANALLAVVVIMAIFVVKLISVNQSEKAKEVDASSVKSAKATQVVKATPKPTPKPTPKRTGSDFWLRPDLDQSKPMVALTFDDGPYAPVTREILATLKKYNAKATFFIVGDRLKTYAETLQAEYDLGCEVASHTHDHIVLTKLSPQGIRSQIAKANKAISKVIGCKATALRPPGGGVNDTVRKNVGLPMICWDVDTEDWKSRNKKQILSRCKNIQDGDIVLMHDLYPTTAQAVKALVPSLVKKGFQLVTVDELFYYKGIKLENGTVYYDAIVKK